MAAGSFAAPPETTAWSRLMVNRNWLGFWFMVPTMIFLLLFLAWPLVLGMWMSMTDMRIGRGGVFIGLENYQFLLDDRDFINATVFTLVYTAVASVVKFAVGLYLAILLNNHMPFKAFIRAIVLIPFIVPTVLSAVAFWWIFDTQFSIFTWLLQKAGILDKGQYINWLGDPFLAQCSVIFANIWRGIPFIAITLLAGLQTVSPSLTRPRPSTAPRAGSASASSPIRC